MDARSDGDPGRAWYDAMCAGDERAFESLFHAYYAPLCRFLVAYVEPPAAEEIAQDLFLRLWRDRARAPVRGSIRAYLYVAGRNAALNQLRHARIHERWRGRAGDRPAPGTTRTPEDEVVSEELADAVAAALAELPERARLAATLRWQHQLSYAEIAAVMEISVKGVENQLSRVARALRERLAAFHA